MDIINDLAKKELYLYVAMFSVAMGVDAVTKGLYLWGLAFLSFGLVAVTVRAWLKFKGIDVTGKSKKK